MARPVFLRLFVASALLWGLLATASAQEMGQGEARITSRSDVRLAMESMPGTTRAAVTALGQRIGSRMVEVRRCYAQRVEQNPTVVGTLRLRFLLERPGHPRVEVDRDNVRDRVLVGCITRVLTRLDTRQLVRPTRAIVQLELANTAARGAATAAERAQQAQQVVLSTDAQGNPSVEGGTPDGNVRFTLTGSGAGSGQAVTAAHRSLMSALPGLLDCRRRSARNGRTEGGELGGWILMRPNQPASIRILRNTVANERTPLCVGAVFRRIDARPTQGRGRVNMQIRFRAATSVQEATD